MEPPALAIPANLLALWLTARLFKAPSGLRAAAAGLAWGIAADIRPDVLAVMPFLAAGFLWQHRGEWRAGLRAALILAAATILPILPLTIYNAVAGGDLVLISSQGGVNLWIGNNPFADGSTAVAPGTRSDWWGGYRDTIAAAEAEAGRSLRASEVSRHYASRAWRFVLGEPTRSARLLLWKLRLFWTDWELGNNQPVRFFAERYASVTRYLPLGFWFVAPLGLVGLALSVRGLGPRWPLAAYLVVYSLVVVLFFVNARYRLPVVPVLAIFSAHALVSMAAMSRGKRFRPLAASVASAALLMAVVTAVPAAIDTSDGAGLRLLAMDKARSGDTDGAIALMEQALAEQPALAGGDRSLGIYLMQAGRRAEAETHLARALRKDPRDVEAADALGALLLGAGRFREAAEVAAREQAAAPLYPHGYVTMGLAMLNLGDPGAAESALRTAIRLEPSSFDSVYTLGRLLAGQGRLQEAGALLGKAMDLRERAGEADAFFWMAAGTMVESLASQGKEAEAARVAGALLDRYPERIRGPAPRAGPPPQVIRRGFDRGVWRPYVCASKMED